MTNIKLPPLPEPIWTSNGQTVLYRHGDVERIVEANAALRTELADLRAAGIHSCHTNCTRSGCVNARLRDALELIAMPMHPDGTWYRERLACQQIAVEALKATP